ncbi:unnamed protein product [Rotaria socialis]
MSITYFFCLLLIAIEFYYAVLWYGNHIHGKTNQYKVNQSQQRNHGDNDIRINRRSCHKVAIDLELIGGILSSLDREQIDKVNSQQLNLVLIQLFNQINEATRKVYPGQINRNTWQSWNDDCVIELRVPDESRSSLQILAVLE